MWPVMCVYPCLCRCATRSPCVSANVIVATIIIIIIGVEPIHRQQIKKIALLMSKKNDIASMLHYCLDEWLIASHFFDFILLLFCRLLPPPLLSTRSTERETSHSSLLYIRTQRFCFFSFCFVIFIDILSSCGYFKMHFDVQKCSHRSTETKTDRVRERGGQRECV